MLPTHVTKQLEFKFKDKPQFSYKQYILIRTDMKFSIGKLMVHAAHNSVSALLYAFQQSKGVWEDHERIMKWFNSGLCQAKIILKVKDVEELKKYVAKAYKYKPEIPTAIIKDGGAYEVAPDTIIGAAIGPILPNEAKKLGLNMLKLF